MSRLAEVIAKYCPEGVRYLEIGAVVERAPGLRWSDVEGKELQYIDLSSVDRTTHAIVETSTVTRESAPSRAQQLVRRGDVLFGTTRPMLKRYTMISSEFDGQVASTAFCVLRPKVDLILANYLFHLLGTAAFYAFVEANERGSAYPAIPDGVVKRFRIPVPPLEVQREVAAILDELRELESGLESALESERELRSRQYAHHRDVLLDCGDVEGVRSVSLGELYESSSGLSKSADQFGYGEPFLSFKTVFNNPTVPSELSDLVNATEAEQERYSIRAGDVFVTRTSEDLDGLGASCAALKDYPKATFNGFTKRLRPKEADLIDASFAAYFFRSSLFRTQIARMAVRSTRVSLNDSILLKIRMPLPPMEEQRRVVAILNRFEALANGLSVALPAELRGRRTQYEHYRDRLLTFEEAVA